MKHSEKRRAKFQSARTLGRLAVAEVAKRPVRVVVTVATIALGAGALTSALALGASVNTAVNDGLRVEYANADILVRSDIAAGGDTAGGTTMSKAISTTNVQRIAELPGVADVGTYTRVSVLAQAGNIARGLAVESVNSNNLFRWQGWSDGRAPEESGEIALSQHTLNELKIRLGDQVAITQPTIGRVLYKVVGVIDTNGSMERQSSTYGIVDAASAQALAGIDGPNTVDINAAPGTDLADIVDGINDVAPVGIPVQTSDIISASTDLQGNLIKALSGVVAALAGISCLVAAITAGTTTGASLSSRRRTWALVRCIGAGKRQVAGLVAVESLLLGLVGAVVGILGGLGITRLTFPLVGLIPSLPPLEGSAFTIKTSTILIPLAAALILALVGAVIPAWLAARIAPSGALKAVSSPLPRRVGLRTAVALLALCGGAVLAYGAADGGPMAAVSGGVVLILAGAVTLLEPALYGTAVTAAARARSVPVGLAFRDVTRRPRAAAIEAVAVTLAVAMIALSWVALSSVQEATSARLSKTSQPDLVIGTPSGSSPVSAETLTKLRSIDGVGTVVGVPFGTNVTISGSGPDGRASITIGTAGGSADELGSVLPEGLPVSEVRDDTVYLPSTDFPAFAEGSKVSLTGPSGRVKGLVVQYVKDLQVPSLVSSGTLAKVSKARTTPVAWLSIETGADKGKVIDEVAGVAILNGQLPIGGPAISDNRLSQAIATARAAAVAILAIAVLVAVVGAAATAALSISERAREHAMLRALGLPRRGLGKMLAVRALFVGLVASALGVAVGTSLGLIVSRILITTVGLEPRAAVPVLPILLVVVATVVAVRMAALAPMERASYVPPSRALAQG